jgi:hypothetical protein
MKQTSLMLVLLALAFPFLRADDAPAATSSVISDAEIIAALNLDFPGLEKVKAAVAANDFPAAEQAYLDYRRTASPARWKEMPSDEPAATASDDADADLVINHQIRNVFYFFLPKWINMGPDFNWTYNPLSPTDPRYTPEVAFGVARTPWWDILAKAYWETHDEKYAQAWVAQLRDFAAKNPVPPEEVALGNGEVDGKMVLWRSLDTSIRMYDSWPTAYFHFLDSPSFTPADQWLYLKLIQEHGVRLLAGLQNPKRTGNWVSSECYGLYAAGALFPELKAAASWRDFAIARMVKELDRMVPPDGMEAELTPGYDTETIKEFRGPLDLAKLNHLEIPDIFRTKLLSMYRALVVIMDQSGNDVPTNDSWKINAREWAKAGLELGDDPLLKWAVSDGAEGTGLPDSTLLPYAGFYAMRGGWKPDDLFLFFRAGPTGIGHQHEDMLEVVLRAWNQTLLFDAGKYQYDRSDWRRFSVGTPSHSTIIVDGKWQHRGVMPAPTQPMDNPWVTTPLFDFAAGTYDAGYEDLASRGKSHTPEEKDLSVSHTRRVLFLRPYYALVLDTLDGTGSHVFDSLYQLDADSAKVDPNTQIVVSQRPGDVQLALYPLDLDNLKTDVVKGQKDPLLGWMLTEKGIKATPAVRFRKEQTAPAIFATFLYPYQGSTPALTATPLAAQGDGLWSESLETPREKAEIVLVKKDVPQAFSFTSGLLGKVQVNAATFLVRQPAGKNDIFAGGWGLQAYSDSKDAFTADVPASLVFEEDSAGALLAFNAGTEAIHLTVTRPFAQSVTLPPQAWTKISSAGTAPAEAPALFEPLASSQNSAPQ